MLDRLVEVARQDLAGRTGAAANEITLVSASPQEWRDTSLGCPQPGGMYAQVITPGYRIILQALEKRYEYHTDSTSRAILCSKS